MFFCEMNFAVNTRAHTPARWPRLAECMPVLIDLLTTALSPSPGYIALIFLNLVETSTTAGLLPYVTKAVGTWCDAVGVNVDFWSEKQIGYRVCAWFNQVLDEDAKALDELPELRDELVRCLDVMIRSGVTPARELEMRIVDDGARLTA
jgi:hypothetical protein